MIFINYINFEMNEHTEARYVIDRKISNILHNSLVTREYGNDIFSLKLFVIWCIICNLFFMYTNITTLYCYFYWSTLNYVAYNNHRNIISMIFLQILWIWWWAKISGKDKIGTTNQRLIWTIIYFKIFFDFFFWIKKNQEKKLSDICMKGKEECMYGILYP